MSNIIPFKLKKGGDIMFFKCKDFLETEIVRDSLRVLWRDDEIVTLHDGNETSIYRIYYSYGYNIFALEYLSEGDRDSDYEAIVRGIE